MDKPRLYIGAYASSPCLDSWRAELEEEYYRELSAIKDICGLEHPFYGTLHRDDDDWFLRSLNPDWNFVFTSIPGTMDRLNLNPHFGLASEQEAGRLEAIDFMARLRSSVEKLTNLLQREAVVAVQLHTAPSRKIPGVGASQNKLRESLEEIGSWNWFGAELVVEHCDSWQDQKQNVQKGLLTLDEEILAIDQANQNIGRQRFGMMINWGRSAIDGSSPKMAIDHLKQTENAGMLRGLIFSGCSDQESGKFPKWADAHAPASNPESFYPNPESLMTADQIAASLAAIDTKKLSYLGIKVLPPQSFALEERINLIKEHIDLIKRCIHN